MRKYLSSLLSTGVLLLVVFCESVAQSQTQLTSLKSQPSPPSQPIQQQPIAQPSRMERPLRLSVTVDDESFLQVKEGERIKEGDVITDNRRERYRLTQQRKSLSLRIQSLKDKAIYTPSEPKAAIPSKPLPQQSFPRKKPLFHMLNYGLFTHNQS